MRAISGISDRQISILIVKEAVDIDITTAGIFRYAFNRFI